VAGPAVTARGAPVTRAGIPPLDGLRGVAAALVLLTHVGFITGSYGSGVVGAALARFDIGVALFFTLSGFLLTRPWVSHGADPGHPPPSVRRYAVRRAARILPAYWIALVAVLLTTARGSDWGAIVSNAVLAQVYTGDLLEGFTQTWSLCTEVAFYAVLPLLAPQVVRLGTRRALIVLGALSGLSLLWVALVATDLTPLTRLAALWLPGHLSWFAGGMALAVAEPALRDPSTRAALLTRELTRAPAGLVALAVALFALSCTPIAGPLSLTPPGPLTAVVKEVLYALVALLLVAAAGFASSTSGLSRALASRAGRALGRVSYGVFLWHLLVIDGVRHLLGLPIFSGGLLLLSVTSLIATYLVAEVSWHLVERPILVRAGAHPR